MAIVFAALTWWNPDWPTWFAFWMLGAIASRVFRTGRLGLPVGLAGLVICAVALVVSRAALVPQFVTDWCVAGGLALAVANPAIMRWTTGVRAITRGAGFSYSLYAIHLPVCVFIGALMERFAGWPPALGTAQSSRAARVRRHDHRRARGGARLCLPHRRQHRCAARMVDELARVDALAGGPRIGHLAGSNAFSPSRITDAVVRSHK